MKLRSVRRRAFQRRWLPIIPLVLALWLVVGCGTDQEQDVTENQNSPEQPPAVVTSPLQESGESETNIPSGASEAYPSQASEATVDPDGPYPPPVEVLPTVDAYPGVTEEPVGILLALDRPLAAGSTVVTGEGPPNLFIYIVNVTLMGELLGSGRIDEDGRYSITVPPLEENVRIGVTTDNGLSGLPDTNIRPGDGESSVPQVGYFYDAVVVR